jgi:hypothetical protein
MAPKPDGGQGTGWDPSQGGTTPGTGAGSSSARTSLWDLNGLNEKVPIIIQYGERDAARRVPRQLDPYDREGAIAQRSSPTPGMPADLVKRPILLYGQDPKAYLAFQQALYAGGFYGSASPNSIPWGSDPTGSTYDAWKRVLAATQQAQSAGINLTPEQVLQQGVEQHTAAQKGMPVPKNPLIIQQSDPATLAGIVQQAAQDALGRNLSDGEVQSFVKSFQQQEAAYSKRRYNATEDQSGGTHTLVAPDPEAQAERFVEKGHGGEADSEDAADYIGVLYNLLGG